MKPLIMCMCVLSSVLLILLTSKYVVRSIFSELTDFEYKLSERILEDLETKKIHNDEDMVRSKKYEDHLLISCVVSKKCVITFSYNDSTKNFRWRRWGSVLSGLCTLDPPLNPHRHQREFFGASVWEGVGNFQIFKFSNFHFQISIF